MDEQNMEELLNEYEKNTEELEVGMFIEGSIFSIGREYAVILLEHMYDGVALVNEIEEDKLKINEKIKFLIIKIDDENGQIILSRKEALKMEVKEILTNCKRENKPVKVVVKEKINGGLRVDFQGFRGFMPYSQTGIGQMEDIEEYINEKIEAKIIEWNEEDENLVLSRRVLLDKEREIKKEEFYNNLKIDDIYEGKVHKIFKSGALIDLGGVMGYLHIKDSSWKRIKEMEEIISIGDSLKVQIIKFDKEENKISLSLRDINVNPWDVINNDYKIGEIVGGKIIKDVKYGVLVELETGVVGYLHKDQLREVKWKEEDEITVEIESIDMDEKKIGLRYFDENSVADDFENSEPEKTTLGDLFGDLLDKFDK